MSKETRAGNRAAAATPGPTSEPGGHKPDTLSPAENEAKYQDLVERANDGIAVIQDGIVKYANPSFARMWGGSVAEIIGTQIADHVHPDELPLVMDRYRRRMAGEVVPAIYETALCRKDGEKAHVELNAGIITHQGRPADLVFIRDITERKRADEEIRKSKDTYETLIETLPEGVTATDLEGNITYVSPQTLELHGYDRPEELLGRSAFDFIAPEHRERAVTSLTETSEKGVVKDVGYVLLRKDGTRFAGELSAAVIRDAKGKKMSPV